MRSTLASATQCLELSALEPEPRVLSPSALSDSADMTILSKQGGGDIADDRSYMN